MDSHLLALLLFFGIAVLYSSVGHAGASGYLAVMALLSFAPETIKPTSLVLNIGVAGIASWRYLRADLFDAKVFLSVVIGAMPMAFFGGALHLPALWFTRGAGVFLVLSAVLMAWRASHAGEVKEPRALPAWLGTVIGAPIGFLSGIIGVGGGIFLSPILIAGRWAAVKHVSGIAALFILVNSTAGLFGSRMAGAAFDPFLLWWLLAVIAGGFLGSALGASRFGTRTILAVLVAVLLTAGVKMLAV